MPPVLRKIPFTAELLPVVQGFYCGEEPWEREVAGWIMGGPGGVLEDLQRGCEVWLYVTPEGDLVGFGSLGPSRWEWPDADSPRGPINIIPMVGIRRQFWGKPDGPPEERFPAQILDDLIGEARAHTERLPLLGLFVHPENRRAIRVYEKAGFEHFFKIYRDRQTGIEYQSMLLDLTP